MPDLVRLPLAALLIGVVVAVAAGPVPPPTMTLPMTEDLSPSGDPAAGGAPVLPSPADAVSTVPGVPDPPVTAGTPAPVEAEPQPDENADPILLVVAVLAALAAILGLIVRRARRPAPAAYRWRAAWRVRRRARRRRQPRRRRRRRPEPLGPPWAEDLRRRIEREGARRGRPRRPAESITAYIEALAAGTLPDPRLIQLGAALSAAYFGPDMPDRPAAPPSWAVVLDEVCAATINL